MKNASGAVFVAQPACFSLGDTKCDKAWSQSDVSWKFVTCVDFTAIYFPCVMCIKFCVYCLQSSLYYILLNNLLFAGSSPLGVHIGLNFHFLKSIPLFLYRLDFIFKITFSFSTSIFGPVDFIHNITCHNAHTDSSNSHICLVLTQCFMHGISNVEGNRCDSSTSWNTHEKHQLGSFQNLLVNPATPLD